MKIQADCQLLRIFINESDRFEGRPLYEAIVRAAREQGLAGATVLRAIEGYGASKRIHTVKVLRSSEDLPIVVEVLDQPERIARFMPTLDKMILNGVVMLEKINAFTYKHEGPVAPVPDDDEIQLDTGDDSPAPASQSVQFTPAKDNTHHIIDAAKESAAESRRVFIDSVDVLLAMLCESRGIAERALVDLGIDCKAVKRSLRESVSRDEANTFQATLLEKSQAAAKWLGDEGVGPEHMLLALCEIRPSAATDVLMRLGAQPREISQHVFKTIGHGDDWQRWLAEHPTM